MLPVEATGSTDQSRPMHAAVAVAVVVVAAAASSR